MFALLFSFNGCGDSDNDSTVDESNITQVTENTEEEPFVFTKDFLVGKTLYLVEQDDFGYYGLLTDWNMASLTFSDDNLTYKEIDLPEEDEGHVFSYFIDDNGSVVIPFEGDDEDEDDNGDGSFTLTPVDKNDTTITAINEDNSTVYIFFSEETAKAFRDAKNAESTMNGFTKEFLTDKTLYYVANDDFGHDELETEWNMVKVSFTDTELTWDELVENGDKVTFPYNVDENGSIIAIWTDGDESGQFEFRFVSSNSRIIHVLSNVSEEEDGNTVLEDGYFFFSKEDAEGFMNRQNGVEEDDE